MVKHNDSLKKKRTAIIEEYIKKSRERDKQHRSEK